MVKYEAHANVEGGQGPLCREGCTAKSWANAPPRAFEQPMLVAVGQTLPFFLFSNASVDPLSSFLLSILCHRVAISLSSIFCCLVSAIVTCPPMTSVVWKFSIQLPASVHSGRVHCAVFYIVLHYATLQLWILGNYIALPVTLCYITLHCNFVFWEVTLRCTLA